MALKLSFFKTPKHRVFNYQPLYYDERKEELQERIARAREEAKEEERRKFGLPKSGNDGGERYIPGKNIRTNFRRNFYENRRRTGSPFIMRIVVLLSLAGLMVALYYISQALGFLFQ